LTKEQKCEVDLSDAAAKARKAALDMDTASEDIARANGKAAELTSEIKDQNAKKTSLQGQIKDLEKQRKDDNAVFKSDKLADTKAAALIESAIGLIKDWKNAKKSALIAQRKITMVAGAIHQVVNPEAPVLTAAVAPKHVAVAAIQMHVAAAAAQQSDADPKFVSDAGEAPPPPPSTWEGGAEYKGAGGEQAGIVGILEMVRDDVKKDITKAEEEESQSLKDFNLQKADLEGEITATDAAISAYTKDKAAQEKTAVDRKTARATKKGELDGQMDLYNSYKPGCDFLLVNFDTRTKARQLEVDGLNKAKAILKGGDFSKSFLQVPC